MVVIQFLRSFFRHSLDFPGYDDDDMQSSIVVMDNKQDLSQVKENSDRVIVHRLDMAGETLAISNNIEHDNEMYTHGAFIPKLGMLGIYCEAQNPIEAEFIADHVESILILHKDDLLEKSVGIGAPRIGTVKDPISGTGYHSMVVSVPTHTVSTLKYSHKNPQMLNEIGFDLGIGIQGLQLQAKT